GRAWADEQIAAAVDRRGHALRLDRSRVDLAAAVHCSGKVWLGCEARRSGDHSTAVDREAGHARRFDLHAQPIDWRATLVAGVDTQLVVTTDRHVRDLAAALEDRDSLRGSWNNRDRTTAAQFDRPELRHGYHFGGQGGGGCREHCRKQW